MLASTKWRIALLASYGISGKGIQKLCRHYDGEAYSLSHIYKTARNAGVRIKDYRDCESQEADSVISSIGANRKGGKRWKAKG